MKWIRCSVRSSVRFTLFAVAVVVVCCSFHGKTDTIKIEYWQAFYVVNFNGKLYQNHISLNRCEWVKEKRMNRIHEIFSVKFCEQLCVVLKTIEFGAKSKEMKVKICEYFYMRWIQLICWNAIIKIKCGRHQKKIAINQNKTRREKKIMINIAMNIIFVMMMVEPFVKHAPMFLIMENKLLLISVLRLMFAFV